MSIQNNSNFFREQLLKWHVEQNDRVMPWKAIKDPYKIWLSEIILQQTRVQQGLAYYLRFIKKYPTVATLASAAEEDVYKLWEGLGYYSRCRNLIFTARYIAIDKKGKFPETYEELLQLKGVGPYTAAAIASFAYQKPHAVVDGNVFRILSRFFGQDLPVDIPEGKKWFFEKAENLLDKNSPGVYNQAIMDFGATVCTPKSPSCTTCYLSEKCVAFNHHLIEVLPVKSKKIKKETLFFYYLILSHKDKVLIRKRKEKFIWQNLFEFYMVAPQVPFSNASEAVDEFLIAFPKLKVSIKSVSPLYTQLLTHKKIQATFIQLQLKKEISITDYLWITKKDISTYPFPRIINNYLEENPL